MPSLREELGWLKVILTLCVALDASLVAWLAKNYKQAEPFLAWGAIVLIVAFGVIIALAVHRAYICIRRLED